MVRERRGAGSDGAGCFRAWHRAPAYATSGGVDFQDRRGGQARRELFRGEAEGPHAPVDRKRSGARQQNPIEADTLRGTKAAPAGLGLSPWSKACGGLDRGAVI